MDQVFSAFVSGKNNRRNSSCENIPNRVYVSKKNILKRAASFGSRLSLSNPSSANSSFELISIVDAQLMQIKEQLAAFREQDTQFRERMDSLSDSVSELTSSRSSISSITDLGSLDETSKLEDPLEDQNMVGQSRVFVNGGRDRSNYIRRTTSDPSSLYNLPEEEEEAMETQRHSAYSADQAVNLYPQYNNPEEISTLF